MSIEVQAIGIFSAILLVSVAVTYLFVKRASNKEAKEYRSLREGIKESEKSLAAYQQRISDSEEKFSRIDAETKELQQLKTQSDSLSAQVKSDSESVERLRAEISGLSSDKGTAEEDLHAVMSKLDLYSRLEEFVEFGHFETPDYLYETSARFVEEIKLIRERQRELIKGKNAATFPPETAISDDSSINKRILEGQVKLMVAAFNIECDTLIGKVSPSSYARTLERIEKLANTLEKHAASFACGFNPKYVELKYEECRLQYQHALKKQEEQDEQRQIREQIREEQRAIKEYERAIAQAEKEERVYREMLEKARKELETASENDRMEAEARIAALEAQLAEAEEKEARAKSMAEQTRKGHVYVISNVGSFGKDIYKIGLTRRLDPMDRVKELGDASVPFSFDVHAMIYVEDAPALETALHREFHNKRVNAVNLRKEFFNVGLNAIKEASTRIAGVEAEFKMTALAEDYYESRRLWGVETSVS